MDDLKVGSIVHYCYNFGFGDPPVCVAAIVNVVYSKDIGNIVVREFESLDIKSCLHSEKKESGTWHWPCSA